MSEIDQANERAQFAAREFVARFERETGCELGEFVRERILFAFEMGYLRGRTDQCADMIDTIENGAKT